MIYNKHKPAKLFFNSVTYNKIHKKFFVKFWDPFTLFQTKIQTERCFDTYSLLFPICVRTQGLDPPCTQRPDTPSPLLAYVLFERPLGFHNVSIFFYWDFFVKLSLTSPDVSDFDRTSVSQRVSNRG